MSVQTSITDGPVGFVRRSATRVAQTGAPWTPRSPSTPGRDLDGRRSRSAARTRPSIALPPVIPARVLPAECPASDDGPGYRFGRWARLSLTLTTLAAAVLLVASLLPASSTGVQSVTVRPGDTLWSIASAAAGDADPRGVVEQIRALNGLSDGPLAEGMLLRVPTR
jgi:nucleoid-associated protein YgaU